MHDARRRDQFIRRISVEVQTSRGASDGQIERPHMKTRKSAPHFGVVEVQRDSSELREFRQFPEDDGRNAPRLSGQEGPLARSYVALESMDQDVRVKI